VTSAPLDAAQRDDRFTATIEALQLQLIQVKQDTAKLDTRIIASTSTTPATSQVTL
jgi:hypothetical protein